MERKTLDLGKLYGYGVCLVAVLVFIVASARLTGGILDIREPPYTKTFLRGPSLVSTGTYRMDLLGREGLAGAGDTVAALLPTESEFREMYEAERLYRLALSHQASRRTIMVSVVLLAVAVLVFATHWEWLRRRERSPSGGAA